MFKATWNAPAGDLLEADVTDDGMGQHIESASQNMDDADSQLTADIIEEERKFREETLSFDRNNAKSWDTATKEELLQELKHAHLSYAKQSKVSRDRLKQTKAQLELIKKERKVLQGKVSPEVPTRACPPPRTRPLLRISHATAVC